MRSLIQEQNNNDKSNVSHQLIVHLRCEASYRLEITRT